MLKKISIISPLLFLILGLQTNLYAEQNSKTTKTPITKTQNSKTQKDVKSKVKKQKTQTNKNENKTTKSTATKKQISSKQVNKSKKSITKSVSNKKKTINSKISKNNSITNENFTSYAYNNTNQKKKAFNEFYNETKHIRYKMGGTGQNGIDCSAFTQKMFKEKFNHMLSRSTVTQVNEGIEVKKSELQPGDLVFFKTSKIDKHVGVYTGNGEFLHASIKGIQYTKLDKPFYKDTYWTARRVIN